jgi:hypothetical protein
MKETPVDSDNSRDEMIARVGAEFEDLEQRLLAESPGVQAVMETYALAAAAIDRFETYVRALDARPDTRISNGSA